jgi:hypothetical protein
VSLRKKLEENPFYVLDVRPGATLQEIERAGQKCLGLLSLGVSAGKTFVTPFGARDRTEDLVRQALGELRDPSKRLQHEVWAALPAGRDEPRAAPHAAHELACDAMELVGWPALGAKACSR